MTTTSHEYADKILKLGQLLLSKPEFDISTVVAPALYFWDDKKLFLKAVKALGPGEKSYDGDDLIYLVQGFLKLRIQRNVVCTLVRPAEYACEPLLSQAEEEVLSV